MSDTSSPPTHRLVLLDENEVFWLEAVRIACNDQVPAPTLARVQALRCLFKELLPQQLRQEPRDGQP